MVVKLGQKRRPDDVLGRLVDCHDRIRSFLEVVNRLGSAPTFDSDEVKSAARDVQRYFSEALPRHVEDEEISLLPRLSGRDPELDAALERMRNEHKAHESMVAVLLSVCENLASATEAPNLRERLIDLGTSLRREFEAHLTEEEAIIFPAIERWLPKSEQETILAEMRGRRSNDRASGR